MAAVSRLIALVLMWLACGPASAQVIYYTNGAYPNADPVASCTARVHAAYGATDSGGSYYGQFMPGAFTVSVSASQVTIPGVSPLQPCRYRHTANPNAFGSATMSYTFAGCPGSQVFNATTRLCESPPDPQEELCNALNGTETYASGPGNLAPGSSSCNAVGCLTTFASTLIRVKNAQGQYVTEGAATFTGGKCTYSESTGTAEDACPGGTSGQVNGVTVCVPYDPPLNTIESVGQTGTTTTEGGDTTTSSTSSTTTCANGKCTTTTGVTTSVNGGTPTTKTTTTSEPMSDYCAKNPKAPQCSSAGSFTGSCQSSFVCTGDAVQCATAKATNDHFCKMRDVFEMDASTRALVDGVLAGTWVQNPKDSPRTENLGSFDQTNPLNAACPGDIAINIATVSVVIPLASFCPQLQMMGNLLVAFTLLSATVFVFRGTA